MRPPRLSTATLPLRRVQDLLDEPAQLTVVHGPRGYGKTTQVASWVRAYGLTVGWHTAASAVRGVPPQNLVAEIDRVTSDRAGHPEVIVVDEAQRIRDPDVLDDIISVAHGSPHLRFILCSRGGHAIEPRAAARLATTSVPASQMLLTVDEVAILADRLQARVTDADLIRVHDAFGGWAEPTCLVLRAAATSRPDDALHAADDYVTDVVLSELGQEFDVRVMLQFCVAGRIPLQMVRRAGDETPTGPASFTETAVAAVERAGLALRTRRGDEVEIMLPQVVQARLAEDLRRREPAAARAIHLALARWYATAADAPRGDARAVDALRHAAAADDLALLDQLWRAHSAALCVQHARATAQVLATLPEPVLSQRPSLALGLATTARVLADDADELARRSRSNVLLEYVELLHRPGPPEDSMDLVELLHVGVGRMIGRRLSSSPATAEQYAARLERSIAAAYARGDDPGDRRGWWPLQRGLTWTLENRHDDALAAYRTAWVSRTTDAVHVPANAAANLAMTHAILGNSALAKAWLQRYRRHDVAAGWGSPLIGVGALVSELLLAVDDLDVARAQRARQALDYSGTDEVELWPFVTGAIAHHALLLGGHPGVALAELDAAVASHRRGMPRGGGHAQLVRVRASLLVACGQGERARRQLADLAPARGDAGIRVARMPAADGAQPADVAVPMARVELLSGDPHAALRTAADALWTASSSRRDRLSLRLLAAQAALRSGNTAEASVHMREAVSMHRQAPLLAAFATVPIADLAQLHDLAGLSLTDAELDRLATVPIPYPATVERVALTTRELQLARALTSTDSRQQIADRLFVAHNTVRTQLATLYRKLGVNTRQQALHRLHELGVI